MDGLTRKKLNTLVIIFISFVWTLWAQAHNLQNSDYRYYGANNQEAQFALQSYTYFNSSPSEATIQNDVKNKIKFILGYIRRAPQNPASIYPNYKITTLKIELVGSRYRVHYQISGKGLFRPNNTQYTFVIPIVHGTLYSKSKGLCQISGGSSTFWYYWDPFLAKCPLIENVDYLRVTTPVYYLANTTQTYPEYNRLFVNGRMHISSFFGLAEYGETNWNPHTTPDITGRDYIHQRDELIQRYGMSARVWSESEVRQIYNPAGSKPLPYIEEFSKMTSHGLVSVRLFFGNSGINYDSRAFHIFLKMAFANSQVVIYNGHAGLGKNLHLPSIESSLGTPIKLNPGYQIYFLGSCIPYAYYTDMFFQRKITSTDPQGTKNLDLITFGIESYFSNRYDDRLLVALFDYADRNQKQTYQQIIGTTTQWLFGVNGDEDNPVLP